MSPTKALQLARIILTRQELPASVFVPGTLLFVLLSKFRNIAMKPASAVALTIALLLSAPATASTAAKFGTAQEAKALLNRAVAAVKSNVVKALTMFNNGQNGFKDRDLYVLCANAKDGSITASPSSNGKSLNHFGPGQTVMQTAEEGKVSEITYFWPRPGTIKPLKKHTFYTKIGGQICGVGYWE